MDDYKAHAELCEGLYGPSAGISGQIEPSIVAEGQKEANGEILANGELFMECVENGNVVPLAEFQSLLQRQSEVAHAVADQEKISLKMLDMITHLTKVITDQEHVILSLQQERTGAERMTAEIAMDLRSQYVEISKLKQRYNSAEEQLATVQGSVQFLQDDIMFKDRLLAEKDATILELKERLAKTEAQDSQNEKQVGGSGTFQIQQDPDKRLAEIRSILSRSNNGETVRAKQSPRIEALRATRDSRLQQVRGMLENTPTTTSSKQTQSIGDKIRYDNIAREHSVSSTSEESMSDISSLGSFSDNNHEQRHRLFDALVRQRQQLREMP
eukprot:scaffold4833_cov233-Amphora_coffeaeformis.AAC.3